jgi:hypothetical protein
MTDEAVALAEYIADHIALSGRTQREIACDAGIPNQNFLSMLKTGTAKVPLRRVRALAAALCVPALDLVFVRLNAQDPELAGILAGATEHRRRSHVDARLSHLARERDDR